MRCTSTSVRSSSSSAGADSTPGPTRRPPARQAVAGEQQPLGALVAEAVRPQAGGRHAPDAGRRVADLAVVGGDDLVGVQGDVGAAGDAEAVQLDHRRLVGVQQRGEALGEAAHHRVVEHRVPRPGRVVVGGLHRRVDDGARGAVGARAGVGEGVLGVDAEVVAAAEALAAPDTTMTWTAGSRSARSTACARSCGVSAVIVLPRSGG
jgi:hypothetical protein